MKVLLIIPSYNEEENVEKVVASVTAYGERPHPFDLDYIIINDGSRDRTEAICREKGFRAIHLIQNLGIGGAVQTGYLFAKMKDYDIAVQFDGDGQHDIESLEDLVRPIIDGECDFTVGSRFLEEHEGFRSTAMRRVGMKILSAIIRLVSGFSVADPTSGYRAASKQVIAHLADNYPVDYPEPESLVELVKNGFGVKEVQVNMFERTGGVSSISPLKSAYYMCKVSLAILFTGLQKTRRK